MIEEALKSHLTADTAVAALVVVGDYGRIFPMVIPQKAPNGQVQMPCLVYAVVAEAHDKLYCGTSKLAQCTVSVDAYAKTMKGAREMSAAARTALIDYRGMMGSVAVRDVSLVSSTTLVDMEPGLYRVADTFTIWYEEE